MQVYKDLYSDLDI